MTKIPQARANAADASFPTLADGMAFFNIRRTQASGGSNSTATVDEDDAAATAAPTTAALPDSSGEALIVIYSNSKAPQNDGLVAIAD